jgi:hypothetical protein
MLSKNHSHLDPLYFSVAQLAAVIGCSEKAVRHRIARGQVPGVVRVWGRVYVRRTEVLRFLAEGRGPSPGRSR